jgi:hypothetical protein
VFANKKKNEDEDESNRPGSRLKTPSLPVWVVSGCGHFGVLYNTNRELLHNYHAERRLFQIILPRDLNSFSLVKDCDFPFLVIEA